MAITVRVRNFQSIEDATVVIDGFTVVTGPNNSGKTALMRAMRGVFTNAPAGPLVRRGAAHLTVDINFGDGNSVTWEKGWERPEQKGKTINRYVVNGKELADVGRGCPPEVLALGVDSVQAGSDTVWPQIADQFTGVLFLVGAPGSSMAEAIANIDRVGRLSSALKLAESERRTITSELKVRRDDARTLEAEVAIFDGLDTVATTIGEIEAAATAAESLHTDLATATSLRTRRTAVLNEVTRLASVEAIELPPVPRKVVLTRDMIATLRVIQTGIATHRIEVDALEGVGDVVLPSETLGDDAKKIGADLIEARGLAGRLAKAKETLSGLEGVGDVVLPSETLDASAKKIGADLVEVRGLAARLTKAKETLSGLAGYSDVELPETERVEKVRSVVGYFKGVAERMGTAASEVGRLETALTKASTEYEAAEVEVTSLLGEMGECPTCGTLVSAEGHHAHGGAA